MSHISDSDHRRLDAVVFPDYLVVETHTVSDPSRGLRRVPVTKVWRTERVLGRGGFAEVHLQSQETDKDAKRALKIIHTRGQKLSLTDCQRELTAMIEFTKPKYKDAAVFVDFIGWFQNDDAMFLAMEYMPLGDLEHNIQEIEISSTRTGPPLPEEEIQEIARQVLEGLKIMHVEGFAHRDLKPQNVFVVQKHPQWWVKLGDFGLSKKRTDGTVFRTQAGTQQYMAPELFYYIQELETETAEYTNAVDLWSLGCIIYRIVTGAVPFPSLLSLRNYCRDPSKVPLNIPPTMQEAGKFIQGLLMIHPAERPVASAALESNWLLTKNKHRTRLDDIETSLATINISQCQNNYNTASHKGLQSHYSVSAANTLSPSPSTNEPASEPPKHEPQLGLQKDIKHRMSQGDSVKFHLQPAPEPEAYVPSRHRSVMQPVQSPTAKLVTGSSNVQPQPKSPKEISIQAQQETRQSLTKPFHGTTLEPRPLPLGLPGTPKPSLFQRLRRGLGTQSKQRSSFINNWAENAVTLPHPMAMPAPHPYADATGPFSRNVSETWLAELPDYKKGTPGPFEPINEEKNPYSDTFRIRGQFESINEENNPYSDTFRIRGQD